MTFSRSGPLVPEPSTAAAEKDLVRLAQTGDTEARDELARRHRQPAYFLALQLLGNADDALDVAQDAMLRFFTTLHRFDASRPVRPWLFQIVRNRVLDLYRRRKVRKHDSIDQAAADGVGGENFKSLLQQLVQREEGTTPNYCLMDEQGPDHSKAFQVAVKIGDRRFTAAWGKTKKESEQRAAANALAELENESPPHASELGESE